MNQTKWMFFINAFVVTVSVATAVLSNTCQGSHKVTHGDYEIECIRSYRGILVEIKCLGDDWNIFPYFKVNSANVMQTTFINCSYAQSASLLDIFQSMNINYTEEIHFEDFRSVPSRQNFRNISAAKLMFEKSNITELPFDMLYDVLSIKRLVIMGTNLVQIPNNFFENWSRDLRSVDFLNNKLRKIAKSDLAQLSGVQELILYGNEISEIEAGTFDNMSSLKVLELGNNHLHMLPPGIFHKLTRLEIISIGQNPFDQLPNDLFTSIQNCRLKKIRINFINGSLKTLPDGFFKNLTFLTDVQLVQSQLEKLPTDLFVAASELVNLNLRSNVLKSLPAGFFKDFRKLRNLDLSDNQIVTLPAGIFENLSVLDELDISYNNLTALDSYVFRGLDSLTKLNASHNHLIKLDDTLCNHLISVESVDFSFNGLTFESQNLKQTSIFMDCMELRYMYLSHNKATEIFDDLALRVRVDLSHNNLSELTTRDIENVKTVGTIDLRNNQISRINLTDLASAVMEYKVYDNNFLITPVQILLGNNPLHCDCRLIDFIRYWKSERGSEFRRYVKLIASVNDADSGESLTCASPAEFRNRNIYNIRPEELDCPWKANLPDDACTNTCTCREYPGKQVLSVDCSGRNLTNLPVMITHPSNWSIELNMSHNILQETPSLKNHHLRNIISLDLSSNKISKVTVDVFSTSLVQLKLHDNEISRLDPRVVDYLANDSILRSLTLHGNRWICDCRARNFYHFVQRRAVVYKLFDVACFGTNDKMYAITVSELCNDLMVTVIVLSFVIAFLGICIGSALALYYKYQNQVEVISRPKHWYFRLFANNHFGKDYKYDACIDLSHKNKDIAAKEIIVELEEGLKS